MTDDELRRRIAEILLPKPWPHAKTYMWYGKGSTCVSNVPPGLWVGNPCGRCGEPVYNELGCPQPPKLTDPWPVLAERLRNELVQKQTPERWGRFWVECYTAYGKNLTANQWEDWFCFTATARQRCEVLVKAIRKDKP